MTRVQRMTVTAIAIFTTVAGLVMWRWAHYGAASIYGMAVFAVLGTKLALSLLPARRWPQPNLRMRVTAVVTVYNEDPALLRACLDSLLAQTFPLQRIIVVDDASTELGAYRVACEYATRHPQIHVHSATVNAGKREALAVGFQQMAESTDVFLAVDSDTALEPTAVWEGLRPFRSHRVTATTGLVLPSNYGRNLLTRLIDVRYANAFLGERGAYSRLGSVLCVCGSLALYRADVVLDNLDDFRTQMFLGRRAVAGDDRRLTNYCLQRGQVVLAENAIAHTAVPERFGHFVRQQSRWGRSFFRESWWVLRRRSPLAMAWWLTLLEVTQTAILPTFLVYVLAVHPLLTGQVLIAQYAVFIAAMAVARSVRYFDVRRQGQSVPSRLLTFSVSALYGYLNIAVMVPLRIYSLLTLRTVKWGTRQQVEVTTEPARFPADLVSTPAR